MKNEFLVWLFVYNKLTLEVILRKDLNVFQHSYDSTCIMVYQTKTYKLVFHYSIPCLGTWPRHCPLMQNVALDVTVSGSSGVSPPPWGTGGPRRGIERPSNVLAGPDGYRLAVQKTTRPCRIFEIGVMVKNCEELQRC